MTATVSALAAAKLRAGEIARVAPTSDLIAFYIGRVRDEFPAEVRRTIAP